MGKNNTRLLKFLGDLHHCEADGELKKRLRADPEAVFEHYGLSEWQRELLFSLNRERIAEAIYWEIALSDPYEDDRAQGGKVTILWAHPHRELTNVSKVITISDTAVLEVSSVGLRRHARFELVTREATYVMAGQPSYRGDLDEQTWSVTFDLGDVEPGRLLRLRVDDRSGTLVYPHPIKAVPAGP